MEFVVNCLGWFILYSVVDFGREKGKELIDVLSLRGWIVVVFVVVAVYLINLKF